MKKRGFTFLELLIALSLFAIGMISVLQIFPVNRRFLAQSANSTQAVYLCQEQIENVKSVPYASLTIGTYEPSEAMATTGPLSLYSRATTVTILDTSLQPIATQTIANDVGFKKVDVTVSWKERTLNRSYTLSTYVYNP